jgi:hypothetical protein
MANVTVDFSDITQPDRAAGPCFSFAPVRDQSSTSAGRECLQSRCTVRRGAPSAQAACSADWPASETYLRLCSTVNNLDHDRGTVF